MSVEKDIPRPDSVCREEYIVGDHLFSKIYLPDGSVEVSKDGRRLTLHQWNRELNRFQSMDVKECHPNPIVRWRESSRRGAFLRMVDAQRDETIVDVGCESGYMAEALRERGCRVVCVDIDPSIVQAAQRRLGPDGAFFVVSDVQSIPLHEGCADVVLASEILEHLPFPERGLRELIRVVRPGGRLFLSVPNEPLVLFVKRCLVRTGLARLLGRLNRELAIGHFRVFNKSELRRLCRSATGASTLEIRYHWPFCLNVFAVLRRDGS